jgi:hypothetical protein
VCLSIGTKGRSKRMERGGYGMGGSFHYLLCRQFSSPSSSFKFLSIFAIVSHNLSLSLTLQGRICVNFHPAMWTASLSWRRYSCVWLLTPFDLGPRPCCSRVLKTYINYLGPHIYLPRQPPLCRSVTFSTHRQRFFKVALCTGTIVQRNTCHHVVRESRVAVASEL